MKANKKAYEIVVVFGPKTEEKAVNSALNKVEQWLSSKETKITDKNHMGQKTLAYPITGFDKGDFWLLTTEGENPVKINELNVLLNREPSIIRYLVLNK